jgi:hypothetical protein
LSQISASADLELSSTLVAAASMMIFQFLGRLSFSMSAAILINAGNPGWTGALEVINRPIPANRGKLH